MTHRRPKTPGSFRDDLGSVIDRISPTDHKLPARPQRPKERRVSTSAELNDRLFANAWRKSD